MLPHWNIKKARKFLLTTAWMACLFCLSGVYDYFQTVSVNTTSQWLSETLAQAKQWGTQTHISFLRDSLRTVYLSWTDSKEDLVQAGQEPLVFRPWVQFQVGYPDFPIVRENLEVPAEKVTSRQVAAVTASEFKSSRKVFVIGDSMLKSALHIYLKNQLEKEWNAKVEIFSKSGTGLSRPEVFDWTQLLQSEKTRYDDVMIFLGTNDAQNFQLSKKVIPFGSEDWDQEYLKRAQSLLELACSKSHRVFWVGMLPMRSESFHKKMKHLNEVLKDATSKSGCSQFVEAGTWLSDKNGSYTAVLGVDGTTGEKKEIKVRGEDGIHLSFEGAQYFAKTLLDYLGKARQ
jgi:hypothetical protein